MFKRRNVVLILAILALIGGLSNGRDLLFNLAYLLGLLLIVSFLWAWSNLRWVHLSRLTRSRYAQAGGTFEERFTVRNTSIIPKLWLEVRDYSGLSTHHASRVITNLGSRSQVTWRVNTVCAQRGQYQLGPLRLSTSDPFGLFPMQRDLTQTGTLVVYPTTVDISYFALPVGVLPGGDALRRRTHYITTNASGVRDYAPGDSYSRIHWPSTARRDRLIVKEFELDPLADIWIVPDMSMLAHVEAIPKERKAALEDADRPIWMQQEAYKLPESTEEYTITIAASLTQYFLRFDRNVGLMAYAQAREVIQPDRGERQRNKILETLAVLRTQGELTIEQVMQAELQVFPRGTTLIVVTPTNNELWATVARQLKRRGLRIVTVLVEPASFGGHKSAEPLATFLQANGLTTYVVHNGDNLSVALSRKPVGVHSFAL
ncbi:MAG: DUF58 domain-containing protein [Anaerolineales bacterium]|nr:DUF58 domain-containing protein [Anaerolineales bacterium]MCB8954565.1 DUF58 domain-containing protein [Ardenticatenales bacterium]